MKTKYASVKREWLSKFVEVAGRRLEELGEIHSLVEEIKSRLAGMGGEFYLYIDLAHDEYGYKIFLEVNKPVPARVYYYKSLNRRLESYDIKCIWYTYEQCREKFWDAVVDEFEKQVNAAIGDLLEKLKEKRDLVFEYAELKKLVDKAKDELKEG